MLAAVGPFAIEEGLVKCRSHEALVRVHNTNTGKIIHARFNMSGGFASTEGGLSIPGVAGTGSPVQLEFLSPGGATTGKLLPTGSVVDTLQVPGIGNVRASLIDAANACCFVSASDLGLQGTELPDAIDSSPSLLQTLHQIRLAASVAMGIAKTAAEAEKRRTVPYIAFVAPPQDAPTLTGEIIPAADADLCARALSSGQPHRALPLTASLCMAVAAGLDGSVVNAAVRPAAAAAFGANGGRAAVRIAMPSGVLTVGAEVSRAAAGGEGLGWTAARGVFFRTQRRLFDGKLYVPLARTPALAAAAAAAAAEQGGGPSS